VDVLGEYRPSFVVTSRLIPFKASLVVASSRTPVVKCHDVSGIRLRPSGADLRRRCRRRRTALDVIQLSQHLCVLHELSTRRLVMPSRSCYIFLLHFPLVGASCMLWSSTWIDVVVESSYSTLFVVVETGVPSSFCMLATVDMDRSGCRA
jgi:hypothetical protein